MFCSRVLLLLCMLLCMPQLPLVPFTFAAVLWDQGEADEGSPWYKNNTVGNSSNTAASDDYAREFPKLITEWRAAFKMPTSNTSNTSNTISTISTINTSSSSSSSSSLSSSASSPSPLLGSASARTDAAAAAARIVPFVRAWHYPTGAPLTRGP